MATDSKASRNLLFSDGSSNKFWNIVLDGSSHTVTFGRVGTSGQAQTKEFDDGDAARKSYDKLVAEKTRKGYSDAAGAGPATGSAVVGSSKVVPAAKGATTKSAAVTRPAAATAAPAKETAAKPTTTARSAAADAPPAETPSHAGAAPATLVDTEVVRDMGLEPNDWARATFRPRAALDRGAPTPFDQEACLKRLAKLKTETYGWEVRWDDLKLPAALSREEAHFWLLAMSDWPGRERTPATHAEKLSKKTFDGKLTVDEIRKLADGAKRSFPETAALAVANLLTPAQYVELLLKEHAVARQRYDHSATDHTLLRGFVRYVLPYVDPKGLEALRKPVAKVWDPGEVPSDLYEMLPAYFYLGAAIGMPEKVYGVTSALDEKKYSSEDWADHYQRPQDLVFGLGSPEIVAAEWRRLKLRMRTEQDVRSFLACTEDTALDCVVASVLAETNKEKSEALLKGFTRVRSPLAAPAMLECKLGAKSPSLARDWLDRNVGCAVTGLIETAAGKGKLAEAAIDYLRAAKQKGHGALIEKAVRQCPNKEAAARVRTEVVEHEVKVYAPFDAKSTPKWLSEAVAARGTVKRRTMPAWVNVATLPPLVIGEKRLSDEQTALVLQVLATTPAGTKHPLLTAIRENIAKGSRDEFAWKLFQLWQEDGFSPKEKWAMGSIGHIGDDACVLKMTPLIRNWPGESQHARAVFGLECLRAIGSSVALMQLSGIAQKLKFKGLKAKAEQFVSEIAEERGLTRGELEDRVVPDCGLDENGRREFSFGPRSFSFALSGDLKPMVRDESGKLRPNLPDPGSKDDAAVAAESVEEWKLLKKQIKEVAAIQAARLEQAMVTGRRWVPEDFQLLLARHPLMTHLVQKVIWAGFDDKGKKVLTFRVTEERDLADSDDNAIELDGVAQVGLVHPLELTEAERERWGEVLGDYEVVSPFPQLGRPIHALDSDEAKKTSLDRFQGLKLVAPTLVFTLEKMHWARGVGLDAGCFDEHSKQFPAAGVTAVVNYEGNVGMGWISPDEMLTLGTVHFVKGMRKPSGYAEWSLKKGDEVALALGKVPPIVISEVIADLQILKSKAK